MDDRQNRLDELLLDPMIRLVMAADKVEPDELRCLVIRRTVGFDEVDTDILPAHVIAACRERMAICACN